jgi:LCP family protein required for cell wall assembly
MLWKMQQLQQSGQAKHLNQDELYFQANEAGRLAEVETVSEMTGVHIDHFVALNLIGFYEMAQTFGGIEVCVQSEDGGKNLTDANSGANLKVGYQHLNAAQSLSFVRERDNLSNGDLDRTHRQQAVLDYMIWDLKHAGLLTDLSQVTSLLSKAKSFLVTSGDWDIALFGTELQGLTGKNLTFRTLPIAGYENNVDLGGTPQDVNLVDLTASKLFVHKAFYPPPAPKKPAVKTPAATQPPTPIPAPSTVTVDVYNGGTTQLLATHVSQALVAQGYKAGTIAQASAQSQTVTSATQVFYGAGATANAAKIAGGFGVTAVALSSLTAGHVEILLGTASTGVPAPLSPAGSVSPSASPTSSSNNGAAGGVLTVKPNAPYGIPCVN